MKTLRILFWVLYLFIASITISSCNKDGKSRLTIYLTDAPATYDAVNIEVVRVEIKSNSDDGENGWKELPVNAGIYNLLDFTNVWHITQLYCIEILKFCAKVSLHTIKNKAIYFIDISLFFTASAAVQCIYYQQYITGFFCTRS